MATNQIRIKDFDEITTHTSDHSMTASASGRAEKRLVAAPRGCALAVLRVHNADGSALGADQTTKAIDFSTGDVRLGLTKIRQIFDLNTSINTSVP